MTASTSTNRPSRLSLEGLLHRITSRILQSSELQEILATTVAEVRAFLASDRVLIYQFHPSESGQVVAESIQQECLPSFLGLHFPAEDIPFEARDRFSKARVRSIVDVKSGQIGQSFLRDPDTGNIVPEEIQYRRVDACHIQYLTAMGIQSSCVVPILHAEQLWGLLVAHQRQPRTITEDELRALQMVVDQLAVAIAQSYLLAQTQEKAQREATINQIASLLRYQTPTTLQTALETTVQALQGSGGRLYLKPIAFEVQPSSTGHLVQCQETQNDSATLYTCGTQPQTPSQPLEQSNDWLNSLQPRTNSAEPSSHPTPWAISDLYQVSELQPLQPRFASTPIRSLLIVPLQYGQRNLGYLTIFRDEIELEILWATQPSFTPQKEIKPGQVQPWTPQDLEFVQGLTSHIAAAILHQGIQGQWQALNTRLERQVEERTAKLQQTTEQQQALLEVVTRIRESLTPEAVFRTATQEVCHLLNVERVAVYRFNEDWGGAFVHDFESTTAEWQGKLRLGENLVWDDTYLQISQGGRYRNNETFAVDDIRLAGLYPCHVDILKQFCIQSFAIAPIFVGQKLWGLLGAYQHSTTRAWEVSDVQFLAQTAAQLGMALQQADLLLQTQQQAQQLSQALKDLQKTQTQLIQTEKISSLGQLVAGIAHEINNPVNFIYGNLTPAREYTEELLSLLLLYQQECPNPSPDIRERMEMMDLGFIAEDLPKLLCSMEVGADRIRQIILSLLNFSRLDQAERKFVDIHEGIESTLTILHHRLKAKSNTSQIQVIKEYGNLPRVECYPSELNQALMNLLSNSIDAIESCRQSSGAAYQGQIIIQTAIAQSPDRTPYVTIRIADNGLGIPEAIKHRIFDPFFTTKPVGKGTGLGLSIAYQIIIDKHHGHLECKSRPQRGAEFQIEIPLKQPVI